MLQIHIFDNKILQLTDVCNEIDIFACLRTKSKTNFCFQFFFFPDLIYKFHYLKYNRFLLMVSFQTFWYIFFFAFAYVTRSHHTFAIICPEWAFFFQIYFVKAKIVTNQQTFQSWINFIIIKIINSIYATAAIIDRTFQLVKMKQK